MCVSSSYDMVPYAAQIIPKKTATQSRKFDFRVKCFDERICLSQYPKLRFGSWVGISISLKKIYIYFCIKYNKSYMILNINIF